MNLFKNFLAIMYVCTAVSQSFANSAVAISASQSLRTDEWIGICPTNLDQLSDEQGQEEVFKSYKTVHDEIVRSQTRIKAQIKTNIPLIETHFKISLELLRFIRNVKTLEPVFQILHEMLSNPKYKSFRDSSSFRAILGSSAFLRSLLTQNYSANAEPLFTALMGQIKIALEKDGVIRALEVTALEGIDLTKIDNLKDGLMLAELFRGVDIKQIEDQIDLNHGYRNVARHMVANGLAATGTSHAQLESLHAKIQPISQFPYPSELKYKGAISKAYQARLKREMVQFLKFYDENALDHSSSIYANEDDAGWSTISYDSIVGRYWSGISQQKQKLELEFQGKTRPVTIQEVVAIDALARTIYGEVNSCEANRIEQSTLVAKIVDDRKKAIEFSYQRQNQNDANVNAMLSRVQTSFSEQNGVKLKDLEAAIRITRGSVYGGLVDFGRTDLASKQHQTHPVTQIVSRGDQFSGWRSVQKVTYGIVKSTNPKSVLPSVEVKLNAPLALGDISALFNQLCPKRDGANGEKDRWIRMVNLAKSVVLDPKFSQLVTWKGPLAQAPLFYTHALPMGFLNEIKLPDLFDRRNQTERMTPSESVNYKGATGACTQIRTWVSKDAVRYFPNPALK